MRPDHAQVEWRDEEVAVGKCHEHGIVDDWVAGVHGAVRNEGVTSIATSHRQWSVGCIQLIYEKLDKELASSIKH